LFAGYSPDCNGPAYSQHHRYYQTVADPSFTHDGASGDVGLVLNMALFMEMVVNSHEPAGDFLLQ
jgi:hypothetical protein